MKAFAGEERNVLVYALTGGQYEDGEWSGESFLDAETVQMTPRPITPHEERRLPSGSYKAGDMKFYARGNKAEYKSGDVIEYTGIKYRVGDISERPEGGFIVYYVKRVYNDTLQN